YAPLVHEAIRKFLDVTKDIDYSKISPMQAEKLRQLGQKYVDIEHKLSAINVNKVILSEQKRSGDLSYTIAAKNYGGFGIAMQEIAAKFGLQIKYGESYSQEELEQLRKSMYNFERSYAQYLGGNSNANHKRGAVRNLALHLYIRNKRIAQTQPQLFGELKEVFGNRKIKAVAVFGTAHSGAKRIFDDLSRIPSETIKGPSIQDEISREAMALAARGLNAIQNY
ncbi:MAG: hypothetical protein NUV67_05605, partial [archaeon]|nr:hypothetical protein [archaeon]